MDDLEQRVDNSEQRGNDFEQRLDDFEKRVNDSEQRVNDSEQRLYGGEQRMEDWETQEVWFAGRFRRLKSASANGKVGLKPTSIDSREFIRRMSGRPRRFSLTGWPGLIINRVEGRARLSL